MKAINILIKLGLLCWNTLLFGWKKGWVSREDIANYGVNLLSEGKDDDDENVTLIAANSSYDDDEILNLLVKLSDDDSDVVDKWRLSNLICLAEESMSDQDKINALQELYSKFDYPEDMESCSMYAQDDQDPLIVMMQVIDNLKDKFEV